MLSFGQVGAPGMVACSAAAAAGAATAAAATGPLWVQNGATAANGKGRTPEPENGVTRGAPRASAEPEQGGNIRMFPRRFCLFLACSLCPFVRLVSSYLAHTMSLLPICLLSVAHALKLCSLIFASCLSALPHLYTFALPPSPPLFVAPSFDVYSRKNGDTLFPTKGRPPITVDLDCLRPLFNLPQPEAARTVNSLSHAHK